MNFYDDFCQCLHSEILLAANISLPSYLPKPYNIIEEVIEAFFYIIAYGKCNVQYPFHYKMQDFDAYCLIYTLQGEGSIHYDGQEYLLTADTIAFIDCKKAHHISLVESNANKSWNYYQMFLKGTTLPAYYCLFSKVQPCVLPTSALSDIPKILKEIENRKQPETLEDAAIYSKLITDLLTELLVEINQKQYNHVIPNYILKIKELFEVNYKEPHTLDSLSELFHRNKYRLSKDFTKYMKVSPIDYLISCRIEVAKDLLWNTEEMIHDIGTAVGIENTNHFITTFKKKTGVTPLTYRNLRTR